MRMKKDAKKDAAFISQPENFSAQQEETMSCSYEISTRFLSKVSSFDLFSFDDRLCVFLL